MPKIVDHDQRRQEYLDALWRVVDREGAAGITVRAVAEEAGTSKSNLAHYFGSEANLLAAAVRQQVGDVTTEIARFRESDLDLESAVEALMLLIPTTDERRRRSEVWLLLLNQQRDRAMRQVLEELNEPVRQGLTELVGVLDQQGLFGRGRDIPTEVRRLNALIDGLSLQIINEPGAEATVRQVVRRHLEDLQKPV